MEEKDCPFCQIARGDLLAVKLFVDKDVIAIMDRYPATRGHVLVLPKRHIEDIYAMPGDLGSYIMEIAIKVSQAVKRQLNPQGLNLIQANEIAAGQTVPHFHLHILPRYKNDSVTLKFGHGKEPAQQTELELVAQIIGPTLSGH